MSDNSRMLGFYSVQSGNEIHVVDTDPFSLSKGGGLTDVTLVKKYEMSEDDYAKRKGTVREFILKKKVEEAKKKEEEAAEESKTYGPETVQGIAVGDRCEVTPGARRGSVMFVGEVENFIAGFWIGVKFDEPVGRADFDGSLNGIKYFDCSMGYGTFVRGTVLTVGDFPERDIMDEGDEEDDEI
jgi:tubulin-folding cofactor B